MEEQQTLLAYLHIIEGYEEDGVTPITYVVYTQEGESVTDHLEPDHDVIWENIPLYDIMLDDASTISVSDIQKVVDAIHGEDMFLELVCDLMMFGCVSMSNAYHGHMSEEEAQYMTSNWLASWQQDLDAEYDPDYQEDVDDIKKIAHTIQNTYGAVGDELLCNLIKTGVTYMSTYCDELTLHRIASLN